MTERDFERFPYGNPSFEYQQFKGYDKLREVDQETNVSNHDLLVAMLRSADAIFHELRCIRMAIENDSE